MVGEISEMLLLIIMVFAYIVILIEASSYTFIFLIF